MEVFYRVEYRIWKCFIRDWQTDNGSECGSASTVSWRLTPSCTSGGEEDDEVYTISHQCDGDEDDETYIITHNSLGRVLAMSLPWEAYWYWYSKSRQDIAINLYILSAFISPVLLGIIWFFLFLPNLIVLNYRWRLKWQGWGEPGTTRRSCSSQLWRSPHNL